MLSLLTLVGSVLVGVLAYLAIVKRMRKRNHQGKMPPGPKGLPLLGNILQIDKNSPLMTFAKWSEEYGDIYKTSMIGDTSYVISNPKWVKEIFSQDAAFTGRMRIGDVADMYADGNINGMIHSDGEHWEQLRRFTLRQLRDFGFGKNAMESLIMEELREILDWMKSREGEAIGEIKDKMAIAVINSLWTIISGRRYKHDDPALQTLTKAVTKVIEDMSENGAVIIFVPWLKHIIPEWSGYNAFRKLMVQFRVMFTKEVEEHKSTYSDEFQRDFIDAFLKEIKATDDVKSAFFGAHGERQLVSVISELFQAGSDTTSTTLDWAFLYLTSFPEVQKNLQKELDAVVGNSRHCSLSDRPSLPYTEAVIAETLRLSSIVPSGVGHRALEDREFHGYAVPKNTNIFASLYHIHHNPRIWGDPDNFRPERFLSPDGKTFKKHEALLPFSIGRRQCAGETLARDTLFLYIANVFQRFEVKFDPNNPNANPGLKQRPGFMLNTKPYKVVFKDRLV